MVNSVVVKINVNQEQMLSERISVRPVLSGGVSKMNKVNL